MCYIDYVLWLVGYPMMVGVVEEDFDTTTSVSTPHVPRPFHPEDIPKPPTSPTSDQEPEPKPPANPEPKPMSAMDLPVEEKVIPELDPETILVPGPEPTVGLGPRACEPRPSRKES
ncbi:hypothetical protein ABG768_005283 [Culter alburnus]|uniref:Uncharacterized protein n=1 Tax=Culter alburnus TaxID=194366 RepID=A0AAW1ZUP7_CULAL